MFILKESLAILKKLYIFCKNLEYRISALKKSCNMDFTREKSEKETTF